MGSGHEFCAAVSRVACAVPGAWVRACATLRSCATVSPCARYEHLAKYVDSNEKRWQQTLRVKRGLADQTQTGAYCKDQVYFVGAHRLLKSRRHVDFKELYAGRIPIESLHQCIRLRAGRAARSYASSTADAGVPQPPKASAPRNTHTRRLSAGSDSSSGGSDTSCCGAGAGAGAGAGSREPIPKVLSLRATQSVSTPGSASGVQLPAVRGSQPAPDTTAASARASAAAPAAPRGGSARPRPRRATHRRTGTGSDSDGGAHTVAFGGKSSRTATKAARASHLPPVKLPPFMKDMAAYMRQLDEIAAANGIK